MAGGLIRGRDGASQPHLPRGGQGPMGRRQRVQTSQAYFSRMRVERSTSRIGSPSLSDTASMTEHAIMR